MTDVRTAPGLVAVAAGTWPQALMNSVGAGCGLHLYLLN